jgi:hypothetical protein
MATSQDAPQDISLITGPVNRLDNPTDREQSTIRHGQQAWHWLRHDHSWADWTQVGAAVVIGRSGAMREAAVNRPVGRRYNVLFAAWLKQFDFENLDKADRSRLFAVMDHLEEIDMARDANAHTATAPQSSERRFSQVEICECDLAEPELSVKSDQTVPTGEQCAAAGNPSFAGRLRARCWRSYAD